MNELETITKLAKAKTLAIKLRQVGLHLPIQAGEGEILIDILDFLEDDLLEQNRLASAAGLSEREVIYLKARLWYHYQRGEDR